MRWWLLTKLTVEITSQYMEVQLLTRPPKTYTTLYVSDVSMKLGKKLSEMDLRSIWRMEILGLGAGLDTEEQKGAAPWAQRACTLTVPARSCCVPYTHLSSGQACGHDKAFWNRIWRTSPTAHGFMNCLNPLMRFLSGLSKGTEPSPLWKEEPQSPTQGITSPTLHPPLFTPSRSQVTTDVQ